MFKERRSTAMKTATRSPFRLAALSGAAFLALGAAAPAFAQDDAAPRGRIVTLGIGPSVAPQYPGADSYGIGVFPILGLRRPGQPIPFNSGDDSASLGLLRYDSVINFGPAVRLQNKRDEDDVGAAVGDVGFTVEVGGFVQLLPSRNFRIRAELRRGVNGHKAWVGSLGADVIFRDDQNTIFSIGPRVRWADNRYNDRYFGVTPAVAGATGLATLDPDGGVYAVGGVANFTRRLGRNWGLQAYAGYDRLVGDAADSPIVRTFGSRDQFSGGGGLWLEFGIGGASTR
jgi:outer membrane scaffolding protein for murein synthesis (MipA/OmpV family)